MSRTVLLSLILSAGLVGCSRSDTRSGDLTTRSPKVQTVTHYGRTLDKDVDQREIAYVLLRAMRDDFLAPDQAAREKALDIQFDVCAANVLRRMNRTSLTDDEFVTQLVFHWTPTVAHYVDNFDLAWPQAASRLYQAVGAPLKVGSDEFVTSQILMELKAPEGDPAAGVVLMIRMVKDGDYWRVYKLEYDVTNRRIAARQMPQPAPAGPAGAGQSGTGQSGAGQSGTGQSGTGQSGAGQSDDEEDHRGHDHEGD